jgi:hypothetical protein
MDDAAKVRSMKRTCSDRVVEDAKYAIVPNDWEETKAAMLSRYKERDSNTLYPPEDRLTEHYKVRLEPVANEVRDWFTKHDYFLSRFPVGRQDARLSRKVWDCMPDKTKAYLRLRDRTSDEAFCGNPYPTLRSTFLDLIEEETTSARRAAQRGALSKLEGTVTGFVVPVQPVSFDSPLAKRKEGSTDRQVQKTKRKDSFEEALAELRQEHTTSTAPKKILKPAKAKGEEVDDITERIRRLSINQNELQQKMESTIKDTIERLLAKQDLNRLLHQEPSINTVTVPALRLEDAVPSVNYQGNTSFRRDTAGRGLYDPDRPRGGGQGRGYGRGSAFDGPKGYTCWWCGELGHILTDCDIRNQDQAAGLCYMTFAGWDIYSGRQDDPASKLIPSTYWSLGKTVRGYRPLLLHWILEDPSCAGHDVAQRILQALGGSLGLNEQEKEIARKHFSLAARRERYDRQRGKIFQPPVKQPPVPDPRVTEVVEPPRINVVQMGGADDGLFVKYDGTSTALVPFHEPFSWDPEINMMRQRKRPRHDGAVEDEDDDAMEESLVPDLPLPDPPAEKSSDQSRHARKETVTDDGHEAERIPETPSVRVGKSAPESPRQKKAERKGVVGQTQGEIVENVIKRVLASSLKISVEEAVALAPSIGPKLAKRLVDQHEGIRETVDLDSGGDIDLAQERESSRPAVNMLTASGLRLPPSIMSMGQIGREGQSSPRSIERLPIMPCIIGPSGEEAVVQGILDSGAEINVLGSDYVKRNKLTMVSLEDAWSRTYSTDRVDFVGAVTERVWLGAHSVRQVFFVSKSGKTSQPLLLGMPFFFATKLGFEYEGESIKARMTIGHSRLEKTVSRQLQGSEN